MCAVLGHGLSPRKPGSVSRFSGPLPVHLEGCTPDQVQTVARFCCESIEDTLPHPSPRPAVEPIVRTRVRAIAFGQIAPRDPGPQHVKYCIYDPSIVRARALPTLRH